MGGKLVGGAQRADPRSASAGGDDIIRGPPRVKSDWHAALLGVSGEGIDDGAVEGTVEGGGGGHRRKAGHLREEGSTVCVCVGGGGGGGGEGGGTRRKASGKGQGSKAAGKPGTRQERSEEGQRGERGVASGGRSRGNYRRGDVQGGRRLPGRTTAPSRPHLVERVRLARGQPAHAQRGPHDD